MSVSWACTAKAAGDRGGVLAVIVDTRTTAHLTGGEIVQAGGIVVAIGAAGLVVGITAVDVCPYAVESVNLPRQAETESLVPVQTLERGHGVRFLAVGIDADDVEEYAVGIVVKGLVKTLEGIG